MYTKDFLVGWMTIKSVVATGGGDVNAADFCDKPNIEDTLTAESVKLLGPYSNCWHNYPPIDPRHRINIIVKGTLPLEADFSNYGLGSSLTLPDDWGKWAAVAATSTTDHDFAHAMSNWDIHDDSLLTEGHTITYPLGTQCPADPLVEEKYKDFDAVDNCTPERHARRLLDGVRHAVDRRPHDRPVRSDLLRRHDALGRQGRRR